MEQGAACGVRSYRLGMEDRGRRGRDGCSSGQHAELAEPEMEATDEPVHVRRLRHPCAVSTSGPPFPSMPPLIIFPISCLPAALSSHANEIPHHSAPSLFLITGLPCHPSSHLNGSS